MQFIINGEVGGTISDFLSKFPNKNPSDLAPFFKGIAGGTTNANITMIGGSVSAEGDVTFDKFVEDDTVTVNGVIFTGKDAPSGDQEFLIGADDSETRDNFLVKINSSSLAKIVNIILAKSVGSTVLNSVINGNTLTIGEKVFTAKTTPVYSTDFLVGPTDESTAQNLAAVLSMFFPSAIITVKRDTISFIHESGVSITGSGTFAITNNIGGLYSIMPGQIGNLCTLAISAHGSVTAFSGGTDGTKIEYSNSL